MYIICISVCHDSRAFLMETHFVNLIVITKIKNFNYCNKAYTRIQNSKYNNTLKCTHTHTHVSKCKTHLSHTHTNAHTHVRSMHANTTRQKSFYCVNVKYVAWKLRDKVRCKSCIDVCVYACN